MNFETIRLDLAELSNKDVLLYGSFVTGKFHDGSDVDISILAHSENIDVIIDLKTKFLGSFSDFYDISVFEALPTIVKASVLQNYKILFGNPPEIGEYLRKYWKECQDYSYRFELPTISEMRDRYR
ncbi:MAG: nucleotidyltransferase domain-containing protein [Candidatus Thorarchaeota archaeon]